MTGVPQEAVSGSPSCFVTVGTVAQILYPISSNQGQFRMEKLISNLLFPEGGWGVTAACPFSALSAVAMAPRIARSCAAPGTTSSGCARRRSQRAPGFADYLRVPVRAGPQ